jgi:hypothetical protein
MAADPPSPRLTPAAEAARREREERQAKALRENLRRRKAQDRGRAAEGSDTEEPPKQP